MFVPTIENPLPALPLEGSVAAFAIDAPQGLPAIGRTCRECDVQARTPTRRLPGNLAQLETTVLYRSFVECGVKMFGAIANRSDWAVVGLVPSSDRKVVMETYPRAVALKMGFGPLPSKRATPYSYIENVWNGLQLCGYACESVIRPTVDQVDAALCAIAAQAEVAGRSQQLGRPPFWDADEGILREGLIVLANISAVITAAEPNSPSSRPILDGCFGFYFL